MKSTITTAVMCACLTFAGGAMAQDAMKKGSEGIMKKEMTMQECKDHIAMAKKDGMKKDDASMKIDKACAEMMKSDGTMKNDAVKKDEMKKGEMKK